MIRLSDRLALPLEWMTLATVVYGARGSGKTSLGAVMAEEVTAAKQRFCAIDLKGDWYGLKSAADGRHEGIPVVVFGGDHADVPLEDGAGAFVGETVAGLGQSCILDLEHLSKGKQVRLLAAFFEALYERNREPLLLLLDEAQRYAPQRPIDPDAARCLGATEDLVKLGRKHGIGPVLFTQRGSGLNKEVSELCDLLVAFRTPGPLDQERIKDWLDANTTRTQRDQVMGQLAGLPTGTAVFASGHPDLKLFGTYQVRLRQTFDSSATPRVGHRRVEPVRLAKPDLDALRVKMAATIERAKAEDPRELRRQIAELRAQLAAAPQTPPAKTERVEVPVVKAAAVAKVEALIARGEKLAERLGAVKVGLEAESRALAAALAMAIRPGPAPGPTTEPLLEALRRPRTGPVPAPATGDASVGTGGLRRMLVALAQRHPRPLTAEQLGVRAQLSSASGTFDTYLGRGRRVGWIEGERSALRITAGGLEALGVYDPLPTGRDLARYWIGELGQSGAARMLQALVDVYPRTLTAEELGRAAAISEASGTFDTYLGRLRRLELVTGPRHALRASEEFVA